MRSFWSAWLLCCLIPIGPAFARQPEIFESQARAALERGRTKEALLAFHKSIDSREPDDPALPELLDEVAELEYRDGRFSDAERSAVRALTIRTQLLGPSHPSVAASMNNLAEVLFAEGRYKDAESYYQRALDLVMHESRPDPEHWAKFLMNLGKVLTARHKSADAAQALDRALNLWTTLGNTFEQAATLGNMALLLRQRRQYAEAEQMYRSALDKLDPGHRNAIAARINLADVLRIQKRYDESERQFRQALAMLENRLGREHPDRASALALYASLLRDTHRGAEASRILAEARQIRQIHARTDGGSWVMDARVRPK